MDLNSALQYLREVKSNLTAGDVDVDGGDTYRQFLEALNHYRKRNIDFSILNSTVQTLFQKNPNLLAGFRHFMPRRQPAAAAPTCAEFLHRVTLRSCADFVNRVGIRFNGGAAYSRFLDCMHAYTAGKATAAAASAEIASIFRDHDDLVREFERFLPQFPEGEAPEKRKIEQAADQPRAKRRRVSPPLPPVAAPEKRRMERDNEMEDLMCVIDVKIGRLRCVRNSIEKLYGRMCAGKLPVAGIHLGGENFTALDLVCIRSLGKFPEFVELKALVEILVAVNKKKSELKREKVRIEEKWTRIRRC